MRSSGPKSRRPGIRSGAAGSASRSPPPGRPQDRNGVGDRPGNCVVRRGLRVRENCVMKTVLFGLDGATYTVLDHLMSLGLMPNLAELCRRGSRAVLESTPIPIT